MMKFKILPKIHDFSDAQGHTYYPGDIVDLPVSYLGVTWLKPVDKVDVKTPEARLEPSKPEEAVVPLETPKTQKKVKKS
jgi:hypothetical protein